jgi:hypothetical protein
MLSSRPTGCMARRSARGCVRRWARPMACPARRSPG